MKNTSRSYLLIMIVLFTLSCEKSEMPEPQVPAKSIGFKKKQLASSAENTVFSSDLIAGQHIDVGEVQVWNDDDMLYVKFLIDGDLTPDNTMDDTSPTLIMETHLSISTAYESIPQNKKGNPVIGRFAHSRNHDNGVEEYTYAIERSWDNNSMLNIAAHAVVSKEGGLKGLEIYLPDQVGFNVIYPGLENKSPSYFDATVSGGTILDGIYDCWCIDTDNVIYSGPNSLYNANVYSSYEDIPGGLLEQPENLDLVNWVINQGFVGKPALNPEENGYYTWGDVQVALWTLIDDEISTAVGSWSQVRVNEILDAAYAGGDEFVPECTQQVAVIIVPVDGAQVTIAQVTFIEVELPCERIEETAWGAGMDFAGKNWAKYFKYVVN